MMGMANAKKESKQGSEASPASAGDGLEPASIEHGAPPRPFDLARRNRPGIAAAAPRRHPQVRRGRRRRTKAWMLLMDG